MSPNAEEKADSLTPAPPPLTDDDLLAPPQIDSRGQNVRKASLGGMVIPQEAFVDPFTELATTQPDDDLAPVDAASLLDGLGAMSFDDL